jgi:DMATS type aromatic prenyltransferase
LDALCGAAQFSQGERLRACAELTEVLAPWGSTLIGARPRQPSELSDDSFPLEFSITFTGAEPEVRVLFEPQSWATAPRARWQAAQELNTRLAKSAAVQLDRLALIEDLFEPEPTAPWSAWHCVRFSRSHAPRYKIYLNPEAQGREHAPERARQALERLGFARYAQRLTLQPNEELKFFSLDLDRDPRARVKLYSVQRGATRESVARALAEAPSFDPAAFEHFWRHIAGSDGPFSGWPVSTYHALVTGDELPSSATVHFPTRAYAAHDRDNYERVCGLLQGHDLEVYRRAIAGFARRPLQAGSGMHAYVSLGQEQGRSRVTVYLACEAYALASDTSGLHRLNLPRNATEEGT